MTSPDSPALELDIVSEVTTVKVGLSVRRACTLGSERAQHLYIPIPILLAARSLPPFAWQTWCHLTASTWGLSCSPFFIALIRPHQTLCCASPFFLGFPLLPLLPAAPSAASPFFPASLSLKVSWLNRCGIVMTKISVFGPQISIFVRVNFFHSVNGDWTNYPPPYPRILAHDPLGPQFSLDCTATGNMTLTKIAELLCLKQGKQAIADSQSPLALRLLPTHRGLWSGLILVVVAVSVCMN